jgi:hypothetical protein
MMGVAKPTYPEKNFKIHGRKGFVLHSVIDIDHSVELCKKFDMNSHLR